MWTATWWAALTDTYFDLTATRTGTIKHGLLDYAWVSNSNKSYKLSGKDLFNSAHKAGAVKHLRKGRYEVTSTAGPRPPAPAR